MIDPHTNNGDGVCVCVCVFISTTRVDINQAPLLGFFFFFFVATTNLRREAHDPNNSLPLSPIHVLLRELLGSKLQKKKTVTIPISMAPLPSSIILLLLLHVPFIFGAKSADHATYIVHTDLSVMLQAFASRHGWYSATLDSIENVLHGFSARLSPEQLEQLKKTHGFVSCHRDLPVKKDTTHTS